MFKNRIFHKKAGAAVLTFCVTAALLSGCTGAKAEAEGSSPAKEDGEKVLTYGDTTFNAENDESDVDPHNGYSGWACIRYGIGETLFKYSDKMELEPWLATEYESVDENTWKITLRDDVSFTSGRRLDAQAVKECLDDLVSVHERAKGDLKIKEISADGQTLTIVTEEPVPALINYLSDPYGCIVDMEAGVTEDGNVAGTGPYIATEVKTDVGLTLVKNEDYWDGEPNLDTIYVKTISDGDTMTMAMQSGELDAAYGLTLKEVGIKVEVNCSADFQSFLDSGDWDIYAGAFVCAPTGDPEYFFTTHCLDESSKNRGGYHSDKLQELENQMKATFDTDERAKLATEMTQTILDDNAFIFASHLRMSIVSGKGVTGLEAHPCDYYEITVDLDKN